MMSERANGNVYYDLEAEAGLLGCAITAPERWLRKLADLPAGIFYDRKHQKLHEALTAMERAREAVDLVTVTHFLTAHGMQGDVPESYVVDLSIKGATSFLFDRYADIVSECFLRRRLYEFGRELMQKTASEDSPEDVRDWAARAVRDIKATGDTGLISMQDAVLRTYEMLERSQQKADEPSNRILSGIATLDNRLGGLRGGEYVAIGARPSVGKSILALTFCVNAARQGKKVLLVSLEMNETQITERVLAGESNVTLQEITSGDITPEGWEGLSDAAGPVSALPLWYSLDATTVEKVRRCAYQLFENGGLDMIAVDYLQLMEATYARRQSRQEQIAEISRGLRLLAAELKIPILVLTQLNRSSVSERVEGRKVRREPTMSEARESGAIEQDANIFILLHDPGKDEMTTDSEKETWSSLKQQGFTMMRLIIDKNRQGKRGRITVAFDGDHMRFLPIVHKE